MRCEAGRDASRRRRPRAGNAVRASTAGSSGVGTGGQGVACAGALVAARPRARGVGAFVRVCALGQAG